jgi:hypothetical protein
MADKPTRVRVTLQQLNADGTPSDQPPGVFEYVNAHIEWRQTLGEYVPPGGAFAHHYPMGGSIYVSGLYPDREERRMKMLRDANLKPSTLPPTGPVFLHGSRWREPYVEECDDLDHAVGVARGWEDPQGELQVGWANPLRVEDFWGNVILDEAALRERIEALGW